MNNFAVKLETASCRSETLQDALLSIPAADFKRMAEEMLKHNPLKQFKTRSHSIISLMTSKYGSGSGEPPKDPLDFSCKPLSSLGTFLVITSAKLLLIIRPDQVVGDGRANELDVHCLKPIMRMLIAMWYGKAPNSPYYGAEGVDPKLTQHFNNEVLLRMKLLVTMIEFEHLVGAESTADIMKRLVHNMLQFPKVFGGFNISPKIKGIHNPLFHHQPPPASESSMKESWDHLLIVFRIGTGIGQIHIDLEKVISAIETRVNMLLFEKSPLSLLELIMANLNAEKLAEFLKDLVPITECVETQIKDHNISPDKRMYLVRLLALLLKTVVWLTSNLVKKGAIEGRKLAYIPGYVFRRILGVLIRETGVQTPYPETAPIDSHLDEESQTTVIELIVGALIFPLDPKKLSEAQMKQENIGLLCLLTEGSAEGILVLLHTRLIARLTETSFYRRATVENMLDAPTLLGSMKDEAQHFKRLENMRTTQTLNEQVLLLLAHYCFKAKLIKNKVYEFLDLKNVNDKPGDVIRQKSSGSQINPDDLVTKVGLAQEILEGYMIENTLEVVQIVCQELLLILRDFTKHEVWNSHQFSKIGSEDRIQQGELFTALSSLDAPLKHIRFYLDLELVRTGSLVRSFQLTLTSLQSVMYELVPPGYFCTHSKSSVWDANHKYVLSSLEPISRIFATTVTDTLGPTNFKQVVAVISNLGLPPEHRNGDVTIDPRLEPFKAFRTVFLSSWERQIEIDRDRTTEKFREGKQDQRLPVPAQEPKLIFSLYDLLDMLFVDASLYCYIAPLLYRHTIRQFWVGDLHVFETNHQNDTKLALGQTLFVRGILETRFEGALKFISWFDSMFGDLNKRFELLDESIYVGLSETEGSKLKHLDPDAKEENRKRGSRSIQIMHAQLAIKTFISNFDLGILETAEYQRITPVSNILDYRVWGQPYFLTVLSLPSPGRDFIFRNFFTNFLKTAIASTELQKHFHSDYTDLVSQILPELDIPWVHPYALKEYSKTIQGAQFVPSVMSQVVDLRKPEFERIECENLVLKPSQIIQALQKALACSELSSLAADLQVFVSSFSRPTNFDICHGLHFSTRLPLFAYIDACFVRIVELFLQSVQILAKSGAATLQGLTSMTKLADIVNQSRSSPQASLATELLVKAVQMQRLTQKLLVLESNIKPSVLMAIITLLERLSTHLPALDYITLELQVQLFKLCIEKYEPSDAEYKSGLEYLKQVRENIRINIFGGDRPDVTDSRIRLLDRYLVEAQLASGDFLAMSTVYEHWKWWAFAGIYRGGSCERPLNHMLAELKTALTAPGSEEARDKLSLTRLLHTHPIYVEGDSEDQQVLSRADQISERDQFYKMEILRLLTYSLVSSYGPTSSAQWFVRMIEELDSSKLSYECGYLMVRDLNLQFRKEINARSLSPTFECFFICVVTKLLCMGTKYTV